MERDRSQYLVETSWLAEHLHDQEVRVVDMRGYVRTTPTDGEEGHHEAVYVGAYDEYAQAHIPGAVYLDWTQDIVDVNDPVEAQVASADSFAEAMQRAGIGDQHLVVAYDSHPTSQFATRLWAYTCRCLKWRLPPVAEGRSAIGEFGSIVCSNYVYSQSAATIACDCGGGPGFYWEAGCYTD
jgi:hypothetical protein